MRLRYIPAVITLSAGTITCIISIVKQDEILSSLKILLIVLIIFYIIGCIARNIIAYAIQLSNKERISDDNEELPSQTEDGNLVEGDSELGEELES